MSVESTMKQGSCSAFQNQKVQSFPGTFKTQTGAQEHCSQIGEGEARSNIWS